MPTQPGNIVGFYAGLASTLCALRTNTYKLSKVFAVLAAIVS